MKKVLSLVLAVVLVLGMGATAFAATNTNTNADMLGISGSEKWAVYRPDSVIEIALYMPKAVTTPPAGVAGAPSTNPNYTGMTRAFVRQNKIGVQIRATEGSNILASYKIDYYGKSGTTRENDVAYIKIKLIDPFVSTKEVDFNFRIYLTEDRKRLADTEYDYSGSFANYETDVYEYDDYVYLEDAPVVEAHDYIRSIEVNLGQGLSLFTKMFEGKRYYGHVSQEIKVADEAVLAKYPDIETVYYLQTIGLAATGEIAQFDLDTNFYAYTQDEDGNLVYIGRTNDRLAYYTKYFLSVKELDVDVVITEPGDILVPGGDEEPPIMGGDGETPANVNDNPGTGR